MSDTTVETEGESVRPVRRIGTWGLPTFVIMLGLVVIWEGISLPLTQQYAGIGSGFIVLAIGLVLVALGIILVMKLRRGETFGPEEAEGVDAGAPVCLDRLAWASAGIILPIILIGWIGFPLAGGLAYACVTRAFGSSTLFRDVVIGITLSSATWFAFTKLGVQLGPFISFPVF